MKNLSISLAFISLLATSQASFAELSEIPPHAETAIETVVVLAAPEVAHFEIFSEKHSIQAMEDMMNIVAANIETSTQGEDNNTEI